jgi:hypothetical protein
VSLGVQYVGPRDRTPKKVSFEAHTCICSRHSGRNFAVRAAESFLPLSPVGLAFPYYTSPRSSRVIEPFTDIAERAVF